MCDFDYLLNLGLDRKEAKKLAYTEDDKQEQRMKLFRGPHGRAVAKAYLAREVPKEGK